jgi:hypothetical protein
MSLLPLWTFVACSWVNITLLNLDSQCRFPVSDFEEVRVIPEIQNAENFHIGRLYNEIYAK